MTDSPLHVEGLLQIGKSHLRAIYQVLDLGEIMRGLRLADPIALITTDVKRLLKEVYAFRQVLASQRLAEVVEYPRLAEAVTYMPDAVQAATVRRHQVAQSPRRLKTLNRGADSRQATSCRPQVAAWRIAASRFPRSLSYQPKASWASANPGRGSSACAASNGRLYRCGETAVAGGVGGAHVPGEQADDRGVALPAASRSASARSAA